MLGLNFTCADIGRKENLLPHLKGMLEIKYVRLCQRWMIRVFNYANTYWKHLHLAFSIDLALIVWHNELLASKSPAHLIFYLRCPQILNITGPRLSQSKSLICSDLIASESSGKGISRSGKWLFYASLPLLKMLIHFNENSVIPQRKQMGNCAGVGLCERVYICVCLYSYIQACLTGLPLCEHMCMDVLDVLDLGDHFILQFSTICKYLFPYLSFCVRVCLCVWTLLGDLGVWSTQSMNKWRALAVGTEVFAKSEDPSSLWTHPAVPLSLSLSAETKTLANQATFTRSASARSSRDGQVRGEENDGEIGEVRRRGECICVERGASLLRDESIKSASPFN